jgi:hypothetical protein
LDLGHISFRRIRRLVPGTEIFDAQVFYAPKLHDGTPARLYGSYFITGYSNLTEQYIKPNGVAYTNTFNMEPSGLEPFNFTLPTGSPSGTYQVKIKAQSIYTNSNTDSIMLSINVNTSAVNQLPVVISISFPDGDSCFIPDVPRPVYALAYDPDGSIAGFSWTCSPVDAGYFLDPNSNPALFAAYSGKTEPGVPSFVKVRAIDNFGEYSYYRSINIEQYLKPSLSECPCFWPIGDANGDGGIDISDGVYMIQYIFAGGPAPHPESVGSGDANCDGFADISDAVYLINYIFAGGPYPGPICDCHDY